MENNSVIRIGTVSSVSGNTAKVVYSSGMAGASCLICKFPNRVTESDGSPAHTHKEGEWKPNVGDQVLVLYAGGFNSAGYIVGVV